MKKLLFIPLLIMIASIVAGCTFLAPAERWCSKVPADSHSVICEVAHRFGTEPEEIALGLEVGSLVVLEKRLYTAKEVLKFLDGLQEKAEEYSHGNVPWGDFIAYVVKKYSGLSPMAQACFTLLTKKYNFDLPEIEGRVLSAYDWGGILHEIGVVRSMVRPFAM